MENLVLNTEIRTTEEKLSEVRASSMVPAVVYGKNQEPLLIKINYSAFLRAFREAGESQLINLVAGKAKIEVLVHEIQREPISGDFLHIDFFAVTRGEKLTTKIALNFIGESATVKEGALLEEQLKEIEVKVLPKNLVESFDVDLSLLKEMGDSIKVSDLNVDPEIFEILTTEGIVVSATKPAKVEEISDDAPEAPEMEDDDVAEETTEA